MHTKKDFCEHNCVQKTFLFLCTIGKCSIERELPFLTQFVIVVTNCVIQNNALPEKYVIIAHQICWHSKKFIEFRLSQFNFRIFQFYQFYIVSVAVSICLSVSIWLFTHTFLPPLIFVQFNQEDFSLPIFSSLSRNCCIST